jgi:predicted permease
MQVLMTTLITAFVTGILFGLAPARHGFRVDPNDSLRDTGARGATSGAAKGASRALVVAEIALAMILVIGAGLMVKSLIRLQAQDTGFNADGVMTFQLSLPQAAYPKADAIVQGYQRILADVRSVPGVQAAAAINFLPLVNFGFNGPFGITGRPPFTQQDRAPVLEFRVVTPGYFQAMGIPILRGRDVSETDIATGKQVVIINQAMAAKFWPDGDPLGERLTFGTGANNENEIVGVVADIRDSGLGTAPVIEAYLPLAQNSSRGMGFVVRTELADPAALLPAVRQRLASIDANLPIIKPQTMAAIVDTAAGGTRLSSVLTAVFAVLAALLASVGIYSLIAYSVAERTRELGIRVALGADRRAVARLIVGEGLRLAALGIAIGLAGSWMLTGTLKSMLYEVSPLDPVVLGGTCLAVVVVTVIASYVPARRALRLDPMIALRAD